jgi:hypothetical protein
MERVRSEESAAGIFAPEGAEVYFHYPLDGIRAPQRFTARMELRRMGVAPAIVVKDGTGHNHLLVDTDLVRTDQPIPSDYSHIHLRKGQTRFNVASRSAHTAVHCWRSRPFPEMPPPVMSKKITVYVR